MAEICIVSSGPPEWHELLKITNETKARYARHHGYHFYADRSSLFDRETNLPLKGFVKFDLLLHALVNAKESYEWAVWVDGDALITNPEVRLEDILAKRPGCGIVTGYDHNGHHTTVIAAHNDQLTKEYLWACRNTGVRLFIEHPWHEMEAMRYFSLTPPYNHLLGYLSVKELCGILVDEYRQFGMPDWLANGYGWKPGDFILHLSALSYSRRVQLATFYANPANHELKPPKAFTPEQILYLNKLRNEIGDEAIKPIVAEMEGRDVEVK